jgi:hypothetical protein
MKISKLLIFCAVGAFLRVEVSAQIGVLPNQGVTLSSYEEENLEQVAKILGVEQVLSKARKLHAQVPCASIPNLEELAARQDILETVTLTALQVEGVIAEINNEQARLAELSAALQARRDHGLNLLNAANLVTGTGIGIGVNALQFSSATANVGNGLGVGSGIGSTVLSIIGIRRQRGPLAAAGRVPNMLAPLFGRASKLNSYYPSVVLEYLHAVPAGTRNTRLEQLMAEWSQTGRLDSAQGPKSEKKIAMLTSSSEDSLKLSIDNISDRVAMLSDVAATVALMNRDLAGLIAAVRSENTCAR